MATAGNWGVGEHRHPCQKASKTMNMNEKWLLRILHGRKQLSF